MGNREKYFGIVPPLVTPLLDPDTLDGDGYRAMLEHVIAGGVHGVFSMASSGQSVHNPYHVWKEASRLTLEAVAGRVPVYSGAIAASTAQVIENIHYLEDIGAKIAVVTQPFYEPRLLQSEILRHYEAVLNKTSIDICVYNMPGLTGGIDILPETIAQLADNERIVMYKDSCPNWDHHLRALMALEDKDISVLVGGEELCCPSILFGSQGNISGLAVSFPKLFVEAYNAAKAQDVKKTVEYQKKILLLKNINHVGPSDFSAMKYALTAVGIGTEANCYHTEPLTAQQKAEIQKIADAFMAYAR